MDLLFGLEFSYSYEENMKLNQTYERIGKDKLWSLSHDIEFQIKMPMECSKNPSAFCI